MNVPPRVAFLDALRGIAILVMVINHTARAWIDESAGWWRYWLVYGTVLLPGPLFLFLVGFCLPIPLRRTPDAPRSPLGSAMPRYAKRGLQIFVAGLALNALVFRDEPLWRGGVLQTIGISVIAAAAAMWLVDRPAGRVMLVGISVLAYLAFARALPALAAWSDTHPVLATAVFTDFPPWPWVGVALIGVVCGWLWLDARARGVRAERRFFAGAAVAGIGALAWYAAWELLMPTEPRFGWPRDYMLNDHWTPRGVTNCLVIGGVALLLAGTYWLTEIRGVPMTWLATLGRTALMLYFVHQVIAITLVEEWLGWSTENRLAYWLATVALIAALLGLGKAWLVVTGGGRAGWRSARRSVP